MQHMAKIAQEPGISKFIVEGDFWSVIQMLLEVWNGGKINCVRDSGKLIETFRYASLLILIEKVTL